MASYDSMLALPTRIIKQLENASDLDTVKRTISSIHIKQLNNLQLNQNKEPLSRETILDKLNITYNDGQNTNETETTETNLTDDTTKKKPQLSASAIDFTPSQMIQPDDTTMSTKPKIPVLQSADIEEINNQNEIQDEKEEERMKTPEPEYDFTRTNRSKPPTNPFEKWIITKPNKPINPKHAQLYNQLVKTHKKEKPLKSSVQTQNTDDDVDNFFLQKTPQLNVPKEILSPIPLTETRVSKKRSRTDSETQTEEEPVDKKKKHEIAVI